MDTAYISAISALAGSVIGGLTSGFTTWLSQACADLVMRAIVETYYTPNRTLADLRELTKTGHGIDPLKDFSAAAREGLHAFAML